MFLIAAGQFLVQHDRLPLLERANESSDEARLEMLDGLNATSTSIR